jgi:Mn2+/Fe2+ NRAMP family transporter
MAMSATTDAFQAATAVNPTAVATTILMILVALAILLLAWIVFKLAEQAVADPREQKSVFAYGLRATAMVLFIVGVFVGLH